MNEVKKANTLKSLETIRNNLQAERKILNDEISNKQKQSAELKNKIRHFQEKIDNLKSEKDSTLIISEHAMLRYIERVLKIDLLELQKKIIPEDKMELIKKMGNCTFSLDGYKIKVKDGVVVTVLGDNNE